MRSFLRAGGRVPAHGLHVVEAHDVLLHLQAHPGDAQRVGHELGALVEGLECQVVQGGVEVGKQCAERPLSARVTACPIESRGNILLNGFDFQLLAE